MTGKISKLIVEKGFGFIAGEDQQQYFMHRSAVRNTLFELLHEGQSVTFEPGSADKGPWAENVNINQ